MFESMLLESGNVLRGRSGIGAKVVDDTKDFTISVYIPPPPEGDAAITSVEAPSSFTPNVPFSIAVHLRNNGGEDWLFARLINKDTGNIIIEDRRRIPSGSAWTWIISVTLPQNTDFHGKVEAGHET